MHARIDSPALTVPGALEALQGLSQAAKQANVPDTTMYLVELRASQINGCSICVDIHSRQLKMAGERDERIFSVAAWREAPYYTDEERAALALTEAGRPPGRGFGRALGGGRPALRRPTAGRARSRDRRHQRLEPDQRAHPADLGRLDRDMACKHLAGEQGCLTDGARKADVLGGRKRNAG